MLPGLRFLFVAIVLSLSMLIFGLGAASLLRSAHEEFGSLPTMRPQPETVFAQQTEANRLTLALLRVDTPVTEQNGVSRPAVPDVPSATAPPQEQSSPVATIEPDRTAAEPDKTAAAEHDRSATPTTALPSEEKSGSADKSSEAPAPAEATARIEMPAPLPENQAPEIPKLETRAAAIPEPTSSAAVAATAAVSEPTGTPTDDGAKAASPKIATLGGPAVTVEPQTASKIAVTPPAKRTQTRRPIKRRRIVHARAAPAPPKPAAPAAVGLFGTPPGG
jgi:hypothetical protein